MRKVKFIEDFDFNVTGGAGGQVQMKAGQVDEYRDELADRLVNHWQVATYHDVQPSNKQVFEPKEQKATYTLNEKGAGWFEIVDEDGDVVDKVRGEHKAQEKLEELN